MTITRDISTGFRSLLRRPSITVLAILTLAIGIGANTAIFSVINGLLIKPLPYSEPQQLVQVWNTYALTALKRASVSIPDYLDRSQDVDAFSDTALYQYQSINLVENGPPERIIGVQSTATAFPLLGIEAWRGRVFNDSEDDLGNESVVVLSYELFMNRFGGDEAIIGRDIRLNDEPHRVIGIMPESFSWPHRRAKLWRPFAWTAEQASDDRRGYESFSMIARLAPGATVTQAQQQIDAIHATNAERFPERATFWKNSGFGGVVVPYQEELFGELRPTLVLLQVAVVLVLLIACANVANLLLTQLGSRKKELAVRSALGANRLRLARQLIVESVLLALIGGVVGIWLGFVGTDLLSWMGVDAAGRGVHVSVDGTVLSFAVLLALLTGIVFGLFPVISLWRTNPNDVIKEAGSRGTTGGKRANLPRNILVVAEVAMAVVLLIGAGLLLRSFIQLLEEDPGFEREGILMARVSLPEARYAEDQQVVAFWDQALERIREIPGVSSAGVITQTPFSGGASSGSYDVEGYELAEGEAMPHAQFRVVDKDYFKTMQIEMLRGRGFSEQDHADSPGVAVIDRLLAEKYFGDENPIGKRVGDDNEDDPGNSLWLTVVGMVETIKFNDLEKPVPEETIYVHYRQPLGGAERGMSFVVRTDIAPEGVTGALRDAINEIDPALPMYNITSMEEQLSESLQTQRVSMSLVVMFGVVAVVLAAIGIYGVLAVSIGQRIREMGMRMALGASTGDILRLVMSQGMLLTAIGAAIGVVAALALGRYLNAQLFEVQPWDPATVVSVPLILGAIAMLACYRPAHRATRIDPMDALREE